MFFERMSLFNLKRKRRDLSTMCLIKFPFDLSDYFKYVNKAKTSVIGQEKEDRS